MKRRQAHSRYTKIVYWSPENKCFIGTCPDLFYGGVHGQDEMKVYRDLRQVVAECERDLDKSPKSKRRHRFAITS